MTMVRNITSHSERAVAIERGMFSNRLSSSASGAAFLVHLVSDGAELTEVPGLVTSARSFLDEVSTIAARNRRRSSQTYRSLIPVEVVLSAFDGDGEQIDQLAEKLRSVLDGRSSEDLAALTKRLDELSEKLAHHAYVVSKASLGS
jgi:hypothetical protein